MTGLDLRPAADALTRTAAGVRPDQLAAATPCPDFDVTGLVRHVGLAVYMLTEAGARRPAEVPSTSDDGELPSDWAERLQADVDELLRVWSQPGAADGETTAGGYTVPASFHQHIALQELLVHGWDLARATGQPYAADEASLVALRDFVGGLDDDHRGSFAAVVAVPDDAPLLDRVVALTGRDPGWSPA